MRLGLFDLHPYALMKEIYSDNIFFTSDNKHGDFITAFQPGLVLQMPFRQHLLTFYLNTTLTEYAHHSSENTTDYYASGLGNFILGDRIKVLLWDEYIKGHEPRSESATGAIEKFRTNSAAASITYLLAEVSKVKVDYTRTSWDYITDEFRSRNEDLVSAYIYYRALPKTSVFGEYDFKNVNYDQETLGLDNRMHTGQIGLSWEITEKSKGTLKGGYLWKNFDQASLEHFGTWTASVDMRHEFSDYNSLKIVGLRTVNETDLLGARYYVTTGLYGEFSHAFLDRLTGVLKGSYGINNYSDNAPGESAVRKDKVYLAGAGVRYLFRKWLELALEYNFRKKDSNMDLDYTENSVIFSVKGSL